MSATPHSPLRSTLRTVLAALAAVVALGGCEDAAVPPLAPSVPDHPVAAANTSGPLAVVSVQGLQPYPGSGVNYGRAYDVNDAGVVVGESVVGIAPAVGTHAMVWEGGFFPTDLGTLGGNNSTANAINNASTIVGEATTASGEHHATMWVKVDGAWQVLDLGMLENGATTIATDISDDGTVVGYGILPSATHAFLWRNGVMTDLGPQLSQAYGVNDVGQVVGRGNEPLDHAVLWSEAGGLTDLMVAGAARAINGSGEVAGYTVAPSSANASAFLWTPQKGRRSLGTLGGSESHAFGINQTGVIVGRSATATGQQHAFAWAKGKMLDLGVLPGYTASVAVAINAGNKVVGSSAAGPGDFRATVWTLK